VTGSAAGMSSRCALLLFCCCHASAQTTSNVPVAHQAGSVGAGEPKEQWTFSASVYTYFPPDGGNYVQPTLTPDCEWLHLEARYNYEALDTGSAWFGYNFSGGDKVAWEFSPMLGGIFGRLNGVSPGYRGSLQWRRLELDSEGEYVIDTANSSASYFYNWSELRLSVLDRLWVGIVAQHTRTCGVFVQTRGFDWVCLQPGHQYTLRCDRLVPELVIPERRRFAALHERKAPVDLCQQGNDQGSLRYQRTIARSRRHLHCVDL